MKLNRILLPALMFCLMLLSACSQNFVSKDGEPGNLNNTSWSYNYFYKNALYNFNFDFNEGGVLKLIVIDNSVAPDSGEERETTINGSYVIDGNILTLTLDSVQDPLNLVYTNFENANKVDLLYSIDTEDSLTLIRADTLFPVLPNEIVLNKVNTDQNNQ